MTKQAIQDVYKEYLSQSSIGFLDEISAHENGHDNSGGHPDYHNDSHDNTPGLYKIIPQKINSDYEKGSRTLALLKLYQSQSSIEFSDIMGVHENGHDNSGGHPDYHNDSHDNTPGVHQMVLKKRATH